VRAIKKSSKTAPTWLRNFQHINKLLKSRGKRVSKATPGKGRNLGAILGCLLGILGYLELSWALGELKDLET